MTFVLTRGAAAIALATLCAAASATAGPVRTTAGLVEGTTTADGAVRVFRGIPFAAPPVGELRWKAPQAAQAVGRRAQGHRVRQLLRAGADLRRHGVPREAERGLPLPQRVDAGEVGDREAAGHGLDPRRRLQRGRLGRAAPRGHAARAQGRRRRHGQLPPRRVRLPRPPGADGRVGPRGLGQLRAHGPDRGAAVGARQRRGVRRRPRQRDDLRRVRRLVRGERARRLAARPRARPPGDRRERRVLRPQRRCRAISLAESEKKGADVRRVARRGLARGPAREDRRTRCWPPR